MGCWNETDFLTQLPILNDDKVKLIIVVPDYDFVPEPRFFPISGEYNDYGCIDNIVEDWNTAFILETCNELLAKGKWLLTERAHEMSKYNKEETKLPFTKIGVLLKAIEREYIISREAAIFSKQVSGGDQEIEKIGDMPVFFVMAHEEIYNNAIELAPNKNMVLSSNVEIFGKIAASIDKISAAHNSEDTEEIITACRLQTTVSSALDGLWLNRDFKSTYFSKLVNDKDFFENFRVACDDWKCLLNFCEELRKGFHKQKGSGSQAMEFTAAALFMEKAKWFALNKEAEFNKEDDEWDEQL